MFKIETEVGEMLYPSLIDNIMTDTGRVFNVAMNKLEDNVDPRDIRGDLNIYYSSWDAFLKQYVEAFDGDNADGAWDKYWSTGMEQFETAVELKEMEYVNAPFAPELNSKFTIRPFIESDYFGYSCPSNSFKLEGLKVDGHDCFVSLPSETPENQLIKKGMRLHESQILLENDDTSVYSRDFSTYAKMVEFFANIASGVTGSFLENNQWDKIN